MIVDTNTTPKQHKPYCVAHYRGRPRNPSSRHAWTTVSRGCDAGGEYRMIECRYCGEGKTVRLEAEKVTP